MKKGFTSESFIIGWGSFGHHLLFTVYVEIGKDGKRLMSTLVNALIPLAAEVKKMNIYFNLNILSNR